MILKISKLLTTALLLAVSFNDSYCMDNNNNNNLIHQYNNNSHEERYNKNMDKIISLSDRIDNIQHNIIFTHMQIDNWKKSSPEIKKAYPCDTLFTKLEYLNNNLTEQKLNFYKQIDILFNYTFANNDKISKLETWDINLLKKLNDILHISKVKIQDAICRRINYKSDDDKQRIKDKILEKIEGLEINNQYEFRSQYSRIFRKIFEQYKIDNIYNNINELKCNDEQKKHILTQIFSSVKYNQIICFLDFGKLYGKFRHNYYNYIVNDAQIQDKLANHKINTDTSNILYQILNNIENNNESDENIKEFFNSHIGIDYEKLKMFFTFGNNQELNYISSILKNNKVKDYVVKQAITRKLEPDILEYHKKFCESYHDTFENCVHPIHENEFKTKYLKKITESISFTKRLYINSIDIDFEKAAYYNTFKRNIANTLKDYIKDMEQYLDNRLQEMTSADNLNKAYIEYLDNTFYPILNNINNKNNLNKNIKLFFDNFIGDRFVKISRIFNIKNNQVLDNINLILQNNDVRTYVLKKLITEAFEMNIFTNRNMLFQGVNDPSTDRVHPANNNDFKIAYLNYMNRITNMTKEKIDNIELCINNIIAINTMQANIKNTLIEYVNSMKQYIDNRLLELTSENTLNNTYTEYLNCYKNKSDVNNSNNQSDNNNTNNK